MKYKIGDRFSGYGIITAIWPESQQYSFCGQIIHERVLIDYEKNGGKQ